MSIHPELIKAEVHMRGSSLSAVARAAKISTSATRAALRRPCYAGEVAIAEFLGRPPKTLWPDRYDSDGTPRHPRIAKQISKRRLAESRQKRRAG